MKHFKEEEFSPHAYVSSLKRGMMVKLGNEYFEVVSMRYLDGKDGAKPHFISCGRTSVAVEISFKGHDPVIAHPDQIAQIQQRWDRTFSQDKREL
jgi:hypothetical protein